MDVLGISAYVIGIVVFLGAAVVYLRGSRDKGTIDSLERQNKAFSEEIAGLHQDVARLTARVSHLESENAHLLAQRPSAEAIEALSQQVAQHDVDMKSLMSRGRA